MSSLSVYHVSSPDLPNKVLTHFDDITATLAEQGSGSTVGKRRRSCNRAPAMKSWWPPIKGRSTS